MVTLSQTYYVAGITLIVRSGNERTNEMKGGRGLKGVVVVELEEYGGSSGGGGGIERRNRNIDVGKL